MSFRTIGTFVHMPRGAGSAFRAGVELARTYGAHLSVIAPGLDRTDPGFYYAGANALVLQENTEHANAEALALKSEVGGLLKGSDLPWDLDTRIMQSGTIASAIAEKARFCDLMTAALPYGKAGSPEDVAALDAILFDARSPVLVVPDGVSVKSRPTRVLLAWNESDEALNAARGALPLLVAADLVDIVIVGTSRDQFGRSDPGGALAVFLSRHGARVEISVIARSQTSIADILMRRARETGADLIVMGAYGHTRMREALVGGATREMLERTQIPVFMAH